MTMWQRFAANTSPIKLSENLMLLQAVQNSVLERPQGQQAAGDQQGSVELARETMEMVKSVLQSAKDPQVALKCIGWLAKKLPFGTQKLEVIKCGLNVAQQWFDSPKSQENPEQKKTASQFLGNFEGAWKKLGTELLLKQYGLLNKTTASLIPSPAKLIFSLYDSSVTAPGLQSMDKHTGQISSVVPKIAELNGVNLHKIQTFMFDKCLPPTKKGAANMDETGIGATLRKPSSSVEVSETDFPFTDPEISKAVFVLKHWDSRQASYRLLSILNQDKSSSGCSLSSSKIRAVCCLLRLLTPDEIQTHMGLEINELKLKLMELLFVQEMENASLPCSLKAFRESNKESLAKAFWRNRTQNRMVLPIVSHLCIDFHIVSWEFLEEILKELANVGQKNVFREILLYCERKLELWKIPSLPMFWARYCQDKLSKGSANEEVSWDIARIFLRCPKYNDSAVSFMRIDARKLQPYSGMSSSDFP